MFTYGIILILIATGTVIFEGHRRASEASKLYIHKSFESRWQAAKTQEEREAINAAWRLFRESRT